MSADVGRWPPGLINSMLELAIKNQGFCSACASRRRETSPMSTLYNKTHVFSDALLKHAPNPFMRNTWHRPTVHGGPKLLWVAQIVIKKQPRLKHRQFFCPEGQVCYRVCSSSLDDMICAYALTNSMILELYKHEATKQRNNEETKQHSCVYKSTTVCCIRL